MTTKQHSAFKWDMYCRRNEMVDIFNSMSSEPKLLETMTITLILMSGHNISRFSVAIEEMWDTLKRRIPETHEY